MAAQAVTANRDLLKWLVFTRLRLAGFARPLTFRAAFELLSGADSYPVLYHCAAGKDRTGVMSALLLTLLGVERGTIIADFRLSEQVGLPGSTEALVALLDDIAKRGGIGTFLSELGVTSDTQERVRALLLAPRAATGGVPK